MTVNAFSDAVEYDLTFRRRGTSVAVTEIYPSAREALDAAIRVCRGWCIFLFIT
jgi:hypothetical protein